LPAIKQFCIETANEIEFYKKVIYCYNIFFINLNNLSKYYILNLIFIEKCHEFISIYTNFCQFNKSVNTKDRIKNPYNNNWCVFYVYILKEI